MTADWLYILTGAPGSGKSTLLHCLQAEGFMVVPEPAQQLIAEQRASGGRGIPGIDNRLFVDLLLDKAFAGVPAPFRIAAASHLRPRYSRCRWICDALRFRPRTRAVSRTSTQILQPCSLRAFVGRRSTQRAEDVLRGSKAVRRPTPKRL